MNNRDLQWPNRPVGELLEKIIDYRGKTPPKSSFGIPVLTAANVKSGRVLNDVSYVSQETYNKWTTRGFPKAGDVLITTEAPVGEVASFPGDRTYLITRRLMALRGKEGELDNDFLKYSFLYRGNLDRLLAATRGSTVPRVLKTDITGLEIPVPPYEEQKRIAHILRTLDDKIELNNQMNSTLEQIAQTLFKRWFIDFEFPNENGDPYKSSGGRMEDSELGEIPEGWEVKKVDEILELAYGKALKEDTRILGSIPVYGSNGQVGWHNQKLVDGPGVVVGRKGNPGTVTWVHTHFYPIDTTFYVVPKDLVKSLYYLLYALKKQDLPSLAADSAVPGLNRNMVYMNRMIVPERNILDLFDAHLNNIYEKIQVSEEQSRALASIRNSLLPKLMSGKIRVTKELK